MVRAAEGSGGLLLSAERIGEGHSRMRLAVSLHAMSQESSRVAKPAVPRNPSAVFSPRLSRRTVRSSERRDECPVAHGPCDS